MADQRIIAYLKENLQRGHSLASLRTALLDKGWDAREVDKAILEVKQAGRRALPEAPEKKSASARPSPGMGLIEKIKTVLAHPAEFFEQIKAEEGIGAAFKYDAILSIIPLVMTGLLLFVGVPFILNAFATVPFIGPPVLRGVGRLAVLYVFSLIGSFIFAGIVYLFARLFKGRGDYAATYKAMVYGATPSFLIGWIPVIGTIIGLFYSLYPIIKGISILHQVSMGRAALIVLILPIIFFVVIFFLGIAYAYFLTLRALG